jgi:hypothetical protein
MRTLTLLATLVSVANADEPKLQLRGLQLRDKAPSYVQAKNALVQHAFLRFRSAEAFEQQQNRLELLRERDRLQLFGVVQNEGNAGYGVAMFAAVTILAAHAPSFLRPLFDGPVHLGPAVFDNGGMGAGIGGCFL